MRAVLPVRAIPPGILSAGSPRAWPRVEVLDGDTVAVASGGGHTGTRIRLLGEMPGETGQLPVVTGIDTPELRGRCEEERALAQEARDTLIRLAAPGVEFITDWQTDKYGRYLARMRLLDGRDAGAVLVEMGLARWYTGRGPRLGWCPQR